MASYAGDPENVSEWYVNIKSIEWKTTPPAGVGSQIAFVAHFLGRRMAYTYEVVELVPDERLVMRTAEGPFPMETSYRWEAAGASSPLMTMRNCGEPTGFSSLMAPPMSIMIRRANTKDLALLMQLLENSNEQGPD